MGGGVTGYSAIPQQRFEAPEITTARTSSPAPSSLRTPAFKGSGMKLGSKKTKQAELLDALGGEGLAYEEISTPASPAVHESSVPKDSRGSLPVVKAESIHVIVKEQLSLTLLREGGLKSMELKGDMNLQITDASQAQIKISLNQPTTDFGTDLQFKQHPKVAKFGAERAIALADSSRGFPVGQPIAVLRWRYAGKDESYVPLSINCWPSPSNDGTCEVNIEYELENEGITLHDIVISIPLPPGSYPTVSSHSGEWALNPSSHSLDWSIAHITSENRSGSLEFAVGGDDPGAFFPVKVSFVGQGSVAGITAANVTRVDNGEEAVFSADSIVTTDSYVVV